VERPVRYVRGNFIYGREFIGDAHLEEERLGWLERANARLHATTCEVPRERFERDERRLLLPLPERPYRSLILLPVPEPTARKRPGLPQVMVERRPLAVYAALAGGGV
jgi:hypothetical protein